MSRSIAGQSVTLNVNGNYWNESSARLWQIIVTLSDSYIIRIHENMIEQCQKSELFTTLGIVVTIGLLCNRWIRQIVFVYLYALCQFANTSK